MEMTGDKITKLKPRALEARIRKALGSDLSDADLRTELELLSRHISFPGYTYLWGPVLHERNRVFFRPFILENFSSYLYKSPFSGSILPWKGPIKNDLDRWLAEVDRLDDVPLFSRLYSWKWLQAGHRRKNAAPIREDFLGRYQEAESSGQRQMVLNKFEGLVYLDQPTAVSIYQIDPRISKPFLLRHLPVYFFKSRRSLWDDLMALAKANRDDDLYYALYRRQAPYERWLSDALSLCSTIRSPEELNAALERQHIQIFGLNLADAFHALLQKRGADVLPYVRKNLIQVARGIWFNQKYDRLVDLAWKRQWFELWAGLIRTAGTQAQFNKEIKNLLKKSVLEPKASLNLLLLLAGVSREWNFPGLGLALVKQLDDETAVLFHETLPELLRGPFKANITLTWGKSYPQLMARLLAEDDGELLDYLAGRLLTRDGRWADKDQTRSIDQLADYYDNLKADPVIFARRTCGVLGQVPAFSIFNYHDLLRNNRLARMFFARSASFYLTDPNSFIDLIEAPEIHVMALAYRVLALDDERARALAAGHIDLLLGTLFRPLHRRTRIAAFGALANGAVSLDLARRIHDKARQAMDLPDLRYPKEELMGLIGRLLQHWPELRGPRENPVIYGLEAA